IPVRGTKSNRVRRTAPLRHRRPEGGAYAKCSGLDVLEREPEIHARLMENVAYLTAGFRRLGFDAHGDSAIIALPVPVSMDIRAMAFAFHARGFFLNHIEYPAVKATQQRFRVSVMARHTREDLDALLEATEAV